MCTLTRDETGPQGVNLMAFCERPVSRTVILIGLKAMAHPIARGVRTLSRTRHRSRFAP